MGSEPGQVDGYKPIRCCIALKYRPSWSCTLMLKAHYPLTIDSGNRWNRVNNGENMIIGATEGPWVADSNQLFFGKGGLVTAVPQYAIVFLKDIPNYFYIMVDKGFSYTGEGLLRSSPTLALDITYGISQ